MTQSAEKVLSDALSLSETERAEVVARLMETLDPAGDQVDQGYDAAWQAELEERGRQLDSGEVKAIPWEDVRRELRTKGGTR